ncbi:MAG: cytochrome c3 family protein [Candidatus Methylomirabilales bacterium]
MRGLRIAGITAGVFAVGAVGFLMPAFGRQAAPAQPIAFSHRVHAGQNQIACLYCHANARRSSVAGIPSVARCMGCHKITAANKAEVKKLKQYWDQKKPIPWAKVTWMPDFVFFQHWPHIRAKIRCQSCHGSVETMDQMEQAKALTMRFCVACHRERKASIDCATCHR